MGKQFLLIFVAFHILLVPAVHDDGPPHDVVDGVEGDAGVGEG